jgi:hypothetical protein
MFGKRLFSTIPPVFMQLDVQAHKYFNKNGYVSINIPKLKQFFIDETVREIMNKKCYACKFQNNEYINEIVAKLSNKENVSMISFNSYEKISHQFEPMSFHIPKQSEHTLGAMIPIVGAIKKFKTKLVEGSHVWNDFETIIHPKEIRKNMETYNNNIVEVEIEKGDALFWHPNMVHCTNPYDNYRMFNHILFYDSCSRMRRAVTYINFIDDEKFFI